MAKSRVCQEMDIPRPSGLCWPHTDYGVSIQPCVSERHTRMCLRVLRARKRYASSPSSCLGHRIGHLLLQFSSGLRRGFMLFALQGVCRLRMVRTHAQRARLSSYGMGTGNEVGVRQADIDRTSRRNFWGYGGLSFRQESLACEAHMYWRGSALPCGRGKGQGRACRKL
jgi:hypothetical protein